MVYTTPKVVYTTLDIYHGHGIYKTGRWYIPYTKEEDGIFLFIQKRKMVYTIDIYHDTITIMVYTIGIYHGIYDGIYHDIYDGIYLAMYHGIYYGIYHPSLVYTMLYIMV